MHSNRSFRWAFCTCTAFTQNVRIDFQDPQASRERKAQATKVSDEGLQGNVGVHLWDARTDVGGTGSPILIRFMFRPTSGRARDARVL